MTLTLYRKIICLVFFCLAVSLLGESSSFDELDAKIVDAFNASPKKTAEVYLYSSEMLSLANKLSSSNSQKWREKAQELITLSCYNEASKSASKGDDKQTLVWCQRALSSGAKQGKISDYDVGDFYKMTLALKQQTETELNNKDESYSKYEISHLAQRTSDITNPKTDREDQKRQTYKLVKGPLQDQKGLIYVIVNTPREGDTKIIFAKGKGWAVEEFGKQKPVYFTTWYDCAKSLD